MSTSDILPYLWAPHGLLKGDTTLHPTWTLGQGLNRAAGLSQLTDPHSHGQQPLDRLSNTFGFKEPEKVTTSRVAKLVL